MEQGISEALPRPQIREAAMTAYEKIEALVDSYGNHSYEFGASQEGVRAARERCELAHAALLAAVRALADDKDRLAHCLMLMMQAYERRIRSDCTTQEQLDKRPWECAEYVESAKWMRIIAARQSTTSAPAEGKS